jgi:hypothetical protein
MLVWITSNSFAFTKNCNPRPPFIPLFLFLFLSEVSRHKLEGLIEEVSILQLLDDQLSAKYAVLNYTLNTASMFPVPNPISDPYF